MQASLGPASSKVSTGKEDAANNFARGHLACACLHIVFSLLGSFRKNIHQNMNMGMFARMCAAYTICFRTTFSWCFHGFPFGNQALYHWQGDR